MQQEKQKLPTIERMKQKTSGNVLKKKIEKNVQENVIKYKSLYKIECDPLE